MPLDASDFADITQIYQEENDSIIDNLGKNIRLFFKDLPTETIADDFYDPVRGQALGKPSYKDSAPEPSYTTVEIKAVLQYNPKDYRHFGDRINFGDNVLRIKAYITDLSNLAKADFIVPNYDVINFVYSKYKLLREPIPMGLKEDRYCISYWEKIT